MPQQATAIALGGGLDLVTPAIAASPGHAIAALNYEPVAGGYQRMQGFERFDGQVSPTDAYDAVIGGGGTVSAAQAAMSAARAAIDPVPGVGPILGVWFFDGCVIAFRNKVGEAEAGMYRSSPTGWEEVEMPEPGTGGGGGSGVGDEYTTVYYGTIEAYPSFGGNPPANGESIVGSTSSASGEVAEVSAVKALTKNGLSFERVALAINSSSFKQGERVTWPGAGSGVLSSFYPVIITAGSPFAEEEPEEPEEPVDPGPVLPPNGRYSFITHNFYGAADMRAMYAVSGVHPAISYDGDEVTVIRTGMTVDRPHRIAVHKQALVLGFPGGSTQISAVGSAGSFDPVLGASEIAIGDEIVDYIPNVQGALAILGANSIAMLYGNDATDYLLQTLSDEAGALPYTAEKMGTPIYMDNRGVRSLSTTQNFGNFRLGTISTRIQPLLDSLKAQGVTPSAACRVRTKDQYRLFFDNGYGLTFHMGGRDPQILPFNLGIAITSVCSIEKDDTTEAVFAGGEDGYIYQLEKGLSFDGAPIDYYLRLSFNHAGAPQIWKRWHRVIADCESPAPATLRLSYEFDYGNSNVRPNVADVFTMPTSGGQWDVSDWDEFTWDAPIEGQAESYLDGFGKTMSIMFAGSSATEPPHLLKSVTIFYSPRGASR
jgi:hypothetical protein